MGFIHVRTLPYLFAFKAHPFLFPHHSLTHLSESIMNILSWVEKKRIKMPKCCKIFRASQPQPPYSAARKGLICFPPGASRILEPKVRRPSTRALLVLHVLYYKGSTTYKAPAEKKPKAAAPKKATASAKPKTAKRTKKAAAAPTAYTWF